MQYRHPTSRLLINLKEKLNKFNGVQMLISFSLNLRNHIFKNIHHFVLSNTPYYLLS